MTQTPISMTGTVPCQCGNHVEVDMAQRTGSACCDCGQWIRFATKSASPADIFDLFGITFSLDYDGQLIVESVDELPGAIRNFIFSHQSQIRTDIEWEGRKQRAVYVGGSKDGIKHLDWRGCGVVHLRIARAHWETYEFRGRNDPRLWFVGRTTSQKKARHGQYIQPETDT